MTPLPEAFLRAPIAHRALHDKAAGRPENSLAAIRAAIDKGYGIEIDLQPSSDGQAMVFHDEKLDRLTAKRGRVKNRSAAELGKIRLSGGDEGIPTLGEVLDLVDGRVPLLIEIKDQDGRMGPKLAGLEEAAARALEGYEGPVAVMSFNPHSMAAMAELAPHIPRGLTTAGWKDAKARAFLAGRRKGLAQIADFDRVGASFISHEARDLANPRVHELKSRGVPVLSWTIRSPAEEAKARKVADNVTFEGYDAPLPG